MFLTDGGTEKPEELFEQYNPNKTVSVFIVTVTHSDGCRAYVQ